MRLAAWYHLFLFGVAAPVAVLWSWSRSGDGPIGRLARSLFTAWPAAICLGTFSYVIARLQGIALVPREFPHAAGVLAGGLAIAAIIVVRQVWPAIQRFAAGLGSAARPDRSKRALSLAVAAAAGVTEEITWRGVQPVLLAKLFSPEWLAIPVAAITYGVVHGQNGRERLSRTMAAAGLHGLLWLSGSLYVGMLVHALWNARTLALTADRDRPKPAPAFESAAAINLSFLAVVVLLSLSASQYRFLMIGHSMGGESSPESLLSGTAPTPFQYRVLVPWIVHAGVATRLVPATSAVRAFDVIEFASLLALGIVFRQYLLRFVGDRRVASLLAPILYFVLPYNFANTAFYPGDMPAALFMALGLLCLYERKWSWFYLVLAVATLNRETSLFLILAYVCVSVGRDRWQTIAAQVAGQSLVWVSIKLLLAWIYRANPHRGFTLFEWHLDNNLELLDDPSGLAKYLGTWGAVWIPVLIWRDWVPSRFLKRSLWIIPPFMATMFVVGVANELRVYGELVPVILAAYLAILVELIRRQAPRSSSSTSSPAAAERA